jgi:PBP1b-binding outer membrane lipoprotein LpoB
MNIIVAVNKNQPRKKENKMNAKSTAADVMLAPANKYGQRFLALGALLLALGSCTPKLNEAKVTFCANLTNYARAVNKLNALDVNSSSDQFVTGLNAVKVAYEELDRSAKILSVVETRALENSNQEFDKAVRSISDKDTLAQADAAIGAAAANAIEQFLQISTTNCTYGPATLPK